MSDARELVLIVFGATGFTGGMTAEYLARHAPRDLRWAIAGRSQAKLDAVKARLSAIDPRHAALRTIVASVDDPASLQRMAAATRVLITTVGPFIDYGEPVVAACIAAGTDYIDSTGEPHFVSLLLGRYAERARAAGVRVVPSCGFDAIPADLGALFTVERLARDKPIRLAGYMRLEGVFSGGTERSALKAWVPPRDAVRAPAPVPSAGRRATLVLDKPHKHREFGKWTTPLETVDGPTVQRSAASLDVYGPDFTYSHNVVHASFAHLLAAGVMFGGARMLVRVAPLRELLLRMVKKPGAGPTPEQMDKAWFKLRFIAESDGKVLRTEVSGGDPGYKETSKMLAESGLCLVRDRAHLPLRNGVLTTAEAMGDRLIARLQRAGMSFRVL
jgi:saccharopine dehydrogenase (NAD+, L-glutamate forming)